MSLINQLPTLRRFVLARLQPKADGGTDKIPTDPLDGRNSDAQDPATWLTASEAHGWADYWNSRLETPVIAYGVGFVLGEGFWCIDLDHCREGDGWAPRAVAVINRFPGAYVEVSQSLESLHVMGYSRELPEHGTRCKELSAECYSAFRFMYTTGLGAYGDIRTDLTEEFKLFTSQFFQHRSEDLEAEWTDAPVAAWAGPIDDAELIARATRAVSAKGIFGRKAMFKDLWTANADALARTFPPFGSSTWDGSGADQALANHLAFWTGKNCTRIAKLMRESALVRPKWDRLDYFHGTILRACADQKEVYREKTRTPPAAEMSVTMTLSSPAIDGVPPPPATMDPAALPTASHVMTVNAKDQYEATLGNLIHILTIQPTARIGYDEFRGCIMIAPTGTEEWQRLTDTDMIKLRHSIEEQQGFASIGREMMRDSLQLVAERYKFDSAITWLNGLAWDGVCRIERFLSDYCGSVDDEYTRAVSLYMWTGLAGRVLDPGCQLDMVIALQSVQGTKKSTALRLLAPHPDAFTDSISLHQDDDNFKRLLRGKMIVEVAEMAGLSKGDINVVKRVITRRTEEWIEKYQTTPTIFERRCMLFATTNEDKFLPPDETGHRRWLPVQIIEFDRDKIEQDRLQLWAEGAMLWRAIGIQYAEAERLAKERHKAHEQTDVWDTKIGEWLDRPREMGNRTLPPPREVPFTIADLLQGAIGMTAERMDPRAEKRAANVLRLLDFESKSVRVDGVSVRRWVPKGIPMPPAD